MNTNFEKLYNTRLSRFITRFNNLLYSEKIHFDTKYALYESREPIPFSSRPASFKNIAKGQAWGQNWQRAWFNLNATIPAAWKGRHVVAVIDIGAEGLVFDENGMPINAVSVHTIWAPNTFKRDLLQVAECAQGGENVQYWIDATATELFGLKEIPQSEQRPQRYGEHKAIMGECFLAVLRQDIRNLLLDYKVLFDLMQSLPEQGAQRARILHTLNQLADHFQPDEATVERCRILLHKELLKTTSASTLSTCAVGHAHIDTGWLWPVHETYRKCARTFATQLRNIEKYPEYIFGASQAQHYAFVKKFYPELYSQIQTQVAAGRWEIQGGMWVEADCNITGGESLVRQILYGKSFFQKEFGIDVNNLWLPDVFGYSAALPQILKKSGIDFFVTQKLSWSQFNKFPHHTFQWRGIDGTEVITHFPPEDNYNSELQPSKLRYAQDNFQEKAFLDEFLTLFGIGDGGGGPTEEHIELAKRQHNLENVPRVKLDSAQAFLHRLAQHKHELPVWVGELYLELHRGTLTTQAYNKKMNRRVELLLRQLEILYSCTPENYPADGLQTMWKRLLMNQFHDIIPGSSISEVYKDSKSDYLELLSQANALHKQAASILLTPDQDKLVLFNSLSVTWQGAIELPENWKQHHILQDEKEIAIQQESHTSVAYVEIAPFSSITLHRKKSRKSEQPAIAKSLILENDLVCYTFIENGTLASIYDKQMKKEMSTNKYGNILTLYEDRPADWDAWDIDIYYENQAIEQAQVLSCKRLADGAVRKGLHFSFKIGKSTIEQKIYLTNNSKRLDFCTQVEWNELHKMLRVAFHSNIKSDTASFEIQYGHVKRPTHRNTSWDVARFEVAAQRWIDLSEFDHGIAMLNDCKYGHKILHGTLDLNLLRSPSSPDPNADQGSHEFIYSILPHCGSLAQSDVMQQAAILNQPPAVFENSDGKIHLPFYFNSTNIILETVKKAQDRDGIILRFYEPFGKSAGAALETQCYKNVWECDLLENSEKELNNDNQHIELLFQPFEIKTILLTNKKPV